MQPSPLLLLLHEISPPRLETPLKFNGLQMQCMLPEKIPASIAPDATLMMYMGGESTFGL